MTWLRNCEGPCALTLSRGCRHASRQRFVLLRPPPSASTFPPFRHLIIIIILAVLITSLGCGPFQLELVSRRGIRHAALFIFLRSQSDRWPVASHPRSAAVHLRRQGFAIFILITLMTSTGGCTHAPTLSASTASAAKHPSVNSLHNSGFSLSLSGAGR